MNFKPLTNERGDCTRSYEVVVDSDTTVSKLISAIHMDKTNTFGEIRVFDGVAPPFGIGRQPILKVGYRSQHLTCAPGDIEALDRKVTQVVADGGWGRMDYYISTEGENHEI